MPKRKAFHEQGGSSQRADRAKAVAAEHGAVDAVVPVPTRRRRKPGAKTVAAEHGGYATLDNQSHGTGFKNGAGAE